jgi:lysophospholipase L1-like esterase
MMKKYFVHVLAAALLLTAGCCCPAEKPAAAPREDVKLLLPDRIYAVPGIETNIYFANVVRVINPANYVFEVKSPRGRCDEKRWRYTPAAADKPGIFKLHLRVLGSGGVLAQKTVTVEVSPADAGKGEKLSMLIVGDSLTNATVYPKHILELFKKPGNPAARQIGSHAGSGRPVKEGNVAHEGYGGWSWARFCEQWMDDARFAKLKTARERLYARSQFLKVENGRKELDIKGYFARTNNGKAPDIITFQLGVNDIFAATDENVDAMIAKIFESMDKLLAAVRKAAPDAVIGVGLTTPGAASQDAFGKNYKSRHSAWQYKKNQHRLVEAMMRKFSQANPYKVELVPVYLNLDCENNFPTVTEAVNQGNDKKITRQNNGVHPAPAGYRQIGDTFYCWMKSVLARKQAQQQTAAPVRAPHRGRAGTEHEGGRF